MNYEIKKVCLEDIQDYVKVNTEAWIESYQGIVSQEFLEKIQSNLEQRIESMKKNFDEQENRYLLLYNHKPVGMISFGKSKVSEYPNAGEIYSLYLLDEVKNMGFGKILFDFNVEQLKKDGFHDLVICCLKENKKANGFYQHMGGVLSFTRMIEIGSQKLEENVYYYEKI